MDNCSALDKSVHNFSEMSYPGEARYLRTLYLEDHVKIAFVVLLMVGTLLGNISVVVVVAFTKSMRTTINLYVVNLAVADLLVCAICMSSLLINFLHGNHIYVLGPVMCKAMYFFQNTFLTSSVLTLSAIACDRFTAILFPFHSRITKQRTGLILTAVWMLSIAVSIPLLFIRKHYTLIFSDFVQPNCGDQWPRALNVETGECETLMWVPQFYYAFVTITLFFLPVVIMTVTYSLILRRLSVSVPGEAVEGNRTAQDRSRKKVIKMVFTVLLVFVLCWMPNQLVILYDKFRKEPGVLPGWYLEAARVSEFLAFSNSFLNPIIYGGYNKNFRDNLCLLLCCKRRRRRFGTPGILQRFRLTLTTALSTSTTSRKPNEGHARKRTAVVVNEDAAPTPNNEAVPQRCAEASDAVQEVKATPV